MNWRSPAGARQHHAEAGAEADVALHLHPALVLPDNTENRGQAQSGALSDGFGGKERFEDARLDVGSLGIEIRHASQVVGMAETPSVALRRKRDSSLRVAAELVKEGLGQDSGNPVCGCTGPRPCPVRVGPEKLPDGSAVS